MVWAWTNGLEHQVPVVYCGTDDPAIPARLEQKRSMWGRANKAIAASREQADEPE